MKRSPVFATLLLWIIAGGAMLLLPAIGGEATQAAPVWAICMIGNLVAVQRSQACSEA